MFRAGDDGLAVARFAWADPDTGLVSNSRTGPTQQLGFVIPVVAGRFAVRVSRGVRYVAPGLQVTLMKSGDFYVRFASGARAGDPVYASLIDGAAISGQAAGAESTGWFVVNDIGPGGLAIISTTCKVNS